MDSKGPQPPAVGTLVYDADAKRQGVVMDHLDGRTFLRPVGGGTEWEADPRSLQSPMSAADSGDWRERLRARVAQANRESRWGI
ncbi:hypothetical protein FHU37_002747 [Allostreptomyces psammosilenae]|uniref:Uncharacterized protein n=1 Tax=Allostreptomyces psammosilenae TaxID=1892865 RepID=A0A852ZYL0_9ACTN|nr:hypothetical protein [Allostreptomyces psammosilenae]